MYGEKEANIQVRATLEEVKQFFEKNNNNHEASHVKPDRKKAIPILDNEDSQETLRKEVFDGDADAAPAKDPCAKRVQVGNMNMMLICEPKETEKVYYKQMGNKNVMVNLTHSSNFYQLLMLAQTVGENQVFPITSDGEGKSYGFRFFVHLRALAFVYRVYFLIS